MSNDTKVIGGIAALSILILVGIVAFSSRGSGALGNIEATKVEQGQIVRDDSHKLGSGAKVVVTEFGDYQCPACGAAYPTLKQITSTYGDKIQFVFRNYPLPQHQNAQAAAMAAEAAGSQNKYWEMHDILYEKQNEWSGDLDPTGHLTSYAKDLGLKLDQFKKDLKKQALADRIAQDMGDGQALGVSATPTIYLNDQKVDAAALSAAVEAALTK